MAYQWQRYNVMALYDIKIEIQIFREPQKLLTMIEPS